MKQVNRKIYLPIVLAVLALSLWGCGGSRESQPETTGQLQTSEQEQLSSLHIVTTSYPQYDFVQQIIGSNPAGIDVTYLLGSGVDMHSYQPSAEDMIKIRTSDLFLYIGGESDLWVSNLIDQIQDENFRALAMVNIVETKEEEIVEGMQDDHDHSGEVTMFADDQVRDRDLSDWAGEWQSVYPYLLDGTLDEVMEHKAEDNSDKTADEYFQYYETGYQTEMEKIVIEGNQMEFFTNGESAKAEYDYKGYRIFIYESGNKGVRYQFEKTDSSDAPMYVQFSDHRIEPAQSQHFHIYFGDDGFDLLSEEMDNWPTYYPATMNGEEIVLEMLDHERSHDDDDDDHDKDDEFDEHVWLSLKNAEVLVSAICEELTEIDPEHGDYYRENAAAYVEKIRDLDLRYAEMVGNAKRSTILVADRFPFRYLADDYGLAYYAAFPGCSAETEASFDTVVFLAEKIGELELPSVFKIEGSSSKIAETVIANSSQKEAGILVLNSIQSVTDQDVAAGVSYLGLMEENLNQLKEALN